MSEKRDVSWPISRRKLLQGTASVAAAAAFARSPAQAAGGKVIIGAFADGGLTPFKDKIIPLAKSDAGFDVEFLEDEYGVTLEKWFADAQSGAGQYDLYLLDDPWVPQFGAANVLEDLGAGGIDGTNSDWIGPFIDMGFWPPRQGPRVKGFEDATPTLITVPFVGDLQTLTYRNDVYKDGAPATWDDLIAKGKEGVAAGTIKYPVVFRGVTGNPIVTSWYPVFLSFGGEFFDDKWNVTFNSDKGKAAADFFVGTMKDNAPPGVVEFDSDQEGAAILGGDAGAIIQYSGNALKADDPTQTSEVGKLDFGVVPKGGEGDRSDRHLHRRRAEVGAEQVERDRVPEMVHEPGHPGEAGRGRVDPGHAQRLRRVRSGQSADPGRAQAARRGRIAAAAHARLGEGGGAARH